MYGKHVRELNRSCLGSYNLSLGLSCTLIFSGQTLKISSVLNKMEIFNVSWPGLSHIRRVRLNEDMNYIFKRSAGFMEFMNVIWELY